MTKQAKIFVAFIAIALVAGVGAWYVFNTNKSPEKSASQPTPLSKLVQESDVILEVLVDSKGESRSATEKTGNNQGQQRDSIDYAVTATRQFYPSYDVKLDKFYLSVDQSSNVTLDKDGRYLVFVTLNQDGRPRVVADGLAVTKITAEPETGYTYSFIENAPENNSKQFTTLELDDAMRLAGEKSQTITVTKTK